VSAIIAEGVSKHWTTAEGEVRAVDGLSFAFAPGTLNVLLGPSGCGKSTTLRLIAGLETADAGRILIGGRDVTNLPPAERNISMVFQSYALFPHLSVGENIVFGLKVRKVATAEVTRRLARVADLLGIAELLQRKPGQLSGGQQQRVALGRAIIAEAPVCLMDEPLSNLDAQLRQTMRSEIRELQQKLGVTMVYVTHDQAEAMSMADRVVLLNCGRLEQDAAPAELYENPANEFVARFVGTPPMNLLPLAAGPDGAVIAGTDGPAVAPIEYLGADSLVTCRLGAATLTARVPGNVGVARGDPTWLSWPGGAQHIFDRDGTRRNDRAAHSIETQYA
jgi:sn-glycerol 3-phosphate transport system ATP-binding protein